MTERVGVDAQVVVRLTKDNFYQWRVLAEADLIERNCWLAIDPGYENIETLNEDQARVNRKARAYLFKHVSAEYIEDVSHLDRAKDIWDTLVEIHTTFSTIHLCILLKELCSFTKPDHMSMQEYVAKMQNLSRKLADGGFRLTDNQLAMLMVAGLPLSKHESFVRTVEYTPNLSTKSIKSKLYLEEARINRERDTSEDDAAALAAFQRKQTSKTASNNYHGRSQPSRKSAQQQAPWRTDGDRSRAKENDHGSPHVKCYACGKWGHIARFCKEAIKYAEQKNSANSDRVRAANAVAKEDPSVPGELKGDKSKLYVCATGLVTMKQRSVWYLDSGATDYMTPDRSIISDFEEMAGSVMLGKGRVQVMGKGTVTLKLTEKCGGFKLQLSHVLFVPDLELNLISVKRLACKGVQITFFDTHAQGVDDGEIVFKAFESGGLYTIDAEPVEFSSNIAGAVVENIDVKRPYYEASALRASTIWHQRLGHLNEETMHRIPVLEGTKCEKLGICSVCLQGKMTRKGFPSHSMRQTHQQLELVHSDIMGKIRPVSIGGAEYVLTFTDDYSRYLTTRFLQKKSEVFNEFLKYKTGAENALGLKLKAIQSDNGGEYVNHKFQEYTSRNGIIHRKTVPYCPQQNGIAERANRTLSEMATCMLIQAGMPKKFWAEAVNTACYIRNRCPNSAIKFKIPLEMWKGKEIRVGEYDCMKVFGCQAWVFANNGKFSPKAEECVFLGYEENVKGYRLWHLNKCKVIIAHHVVFDEEKFPFRETSSEALSPNVVGQLFDHDEDIVSGDVERFQDLNLYEGGTCGNDDIMHDIGGDDVSESPEVNQQDLTNDENEFPTVDGLEIPLRRSKRISNQREHEQCDSCVNCIGCNFSQKLNVSDEPDVKDALNSDKSDKWLQAMNEEIANLVEKNTWVVVKRPLNKNVVGCKWVLKIKRKSDGTIDRFKARLVARGFSQIPGIDFQETFSPVVKRKTIRVLMSLAVERGWSQEHIDVQSAYLNSELTEEIYMEQPLYFEEKNKDGKHYVCKLLKGLYGLKQAGREWYFCIDEILKSLSLRPLISDPCVYTNIKSDIIVGLYVDDLGVWGNPDKIEYFKNLLLDHVHVRMLGDMSQFLSLNVCRPSINVMSVHQHDFIQKCLSDFGMFECKGVSTPLPLQGKVTQESDDEPCDNYLYRKAIGNLLYLSNNTRPDLSFVTCKLSQHCVNPSSKNWRELKHTLRYIKKTEGYKLSYKKGCEPVKVYVDADWGNDPSDRKSITGFVILFSGAAIIWQCRKQQRVSVSTVEAELIAMKEVTKELKWLRNFLNEVNCSEFMCTPCVVFGDNQGAITLSNSISRSERTKHIDIDIHFLRESVLHDEIKFVFIPSEENIADGFTKALPGPRIKSIAANLGLNVI